MLAPVKIGLLKAVYRCSVREMLLLGMLLLSSALLLPVTATYAATAGNSHINTRNRFVVNLSSSLEPFDKNAIPRLDIFQRHRLYVSTFKRPGKTWHRLRLGFYRTNKEASAVRKKVLEFYPRAWVTVVGERERRASQKLVVVARGKRHTTTAVAKPVQKKPKAAPKAVAAVPAKSGTKVPLPKVSIPIGTASVVGRAKDLPVPEGAPGVGTGGAPLTDRTAKMLELARKSVTARDYPQAIQLCTAVLEQPGTKDNKEAIELLGLARERNGQLAHATAEYERFLVLYPKGPDATRVQQRLAGLLTAARAPTPVPEKIAKVDQAPKKTPKWRTIGSVSQFYYRNERTIDEQEPIVDQSTLVTTLNLTSRKVTTDYEHRVEFTGDLSYDFINQEDREGRASTLYYEMIDRSSRRHLRVGRQSYSSGGVLGRFDGINAGVEVTDQIKLDATGGVLLDPDGFFDYSSNRKFISANLDLGQLFDSWDLNLYTIYQTVDDVLDRYAVGAEIRYFDASYSMFNLIDYDVHYDEINVFLLNNNWIFGDSSSLFINLDFRKSPYLTTYNAISSQKARTVEELLNSLNPKTGMNYTLDEVFQLARDRTPDLTTISVGGSIPLKDFLTGYGDYQFSADVTVSNSSSMPASGGVAVTEGTGNEYFVNTQLIGSNMFTDGDITILSLRMGLTKTDQDFTVSLNNRFPLGGRKWRINPVLQYNRRSSDATSKIRNTTRASLKVEYRPARSFQLESQIGIERTRENSTANSSENLFFNLGYRWDF